MQIREWIASQSILNPVASAASNTTKSNGSTDAFSQLFEGKKMIRPERPPIGNPVIQKPLYGENDKIRKPVEKPIYKTDSPPKELNNDSKGEIVKEDVGPSKVDDEKALTEKDLTTDDLKEKIKSMTGLSDDELNALMAMMGIGLSDLEAIVQKLPAEVFGLLEDIQVTLSNLEVNDLLNQPLESELVEKLIGQVKQMENLISKSVEVESDSEILPTFNKVLSSLKDISIQLKEFSTKENVKFDELAKIMDPATVKADVKSVNHQSKDLEFQQVMTGIKEESAKPIATTPETSQQNPSFDSKPDQTPQKIKVEEVGRQATIEMAETDDALAFHQLVMKQPGLVSAQTVQATQVLRQDVFTQVMDAIKGTIKIDDNGTSMLVKLQPEQLGNVELKLNIHKGLVMAEIKVENEIVKAAIESNLDDLRQNLSNKGFTVNQINVSVDTGKKEHQQEMFEFQSNKKSGKNSISSIGEEDQDTEMMIQNYGYDEGNSSTINYLG